GEDGAVVAKRLSRREAEYVRRTPHLVACVGEGQAGLPGDHVRQLVGFTCDPCRDGFEDLCTRVAIEPRCGCGGEIEGADDGRAIEDRCAPDRLAGVRKRHGETSVTEHLFAADERRELEGWPANGRHAASPSNSA